MSNAKSQSNGDSAAGEAADLAQAFQELARGEQTATTLENHLTALEAKIEELLAQADRDEKAILAAKDSSTSSVSKDSDRS